MYGIFLSYKIKIMRVVAILICVFHSVFQHPFVTQPLNRSLAIELLDKMNNPDHSTYHDFDDDDPEVGICFDHRIRLSFRLLTKLNYYDLLICGMFCDLGIVSRVTFTSDCAALSCVRSLAKIHCIWEREAQRKRSVNTFFKIFFFIVVLQ